MGYVNGVGEISDLQKEILINLLEAYQQAEERGRFLWRNAVPWPGAMPIRKSSRSASASTARALKRLEERGLVVRHDSVDGTIAEGGRNKKIRTTHVELTDAGRALAELLV